MLTSDQPPPASDTISTGVPLENLPREGASVPGAVRILSRLPGSLPLLTTALCAHAPALISARIAASRHAIAFFI